MKFSINRDVAYEIISEYKNILKENSVKPILEGLYISVKNNRVIFKGINTEIEFIRYANCQMEMEGDVLIKPPLLLEYIKLLETDNINFEKKEGYLILNDAEFSILDDKSYPELIETSTFIILKENAKKFSKSLEKVKFLTANLPDPLFNSVKINFSNGFYEMISTDSFRLVYLKENVDSTIEKEVLIPIESINIMYKLFKDLDKEISISISNDKLIISWEDAYLTSKVLSMEYKDYKSILDNIKYNKVIEFNSEELSSSLRKVISVTRNSIDSKNAALFDFSGNKLVITGYSSSAKISEKVNMIKTGEDFKIGINCKYLQDFISNLEKNTIIYAQDSMNMIGVMEENNKNYMYILMPVNLRN